MITYSHGQSRIISYLSQRQHLLRLVNGQCSIKLKLFTGDSPGDCRTRIEWLIDGREAEALIASLQKALAEAKKIGLEVI